MTIDIQNYQAYFLDYHEGNLKSDERDLVLEFLTNHPEFQEEFESFEMISLKTDNELTFIGKSDLKKTVIDESVSEQLIALLEGDLSIESENKLRFKISKDQSLEKEWKLIQNTVISPDKAIVFRNKKSLKKNSGVILYLYNNRIQSIAAAIIVLLAGWAILNWTGEFKDAERTINPILVETNEISPSKENQIDNVNEILEKLSNNNVNTNERVGLLAQTSNDISVKRSSLNEVSKTDMLLAERIKTSHILIKKNNLTEPNSFEEIAYITTVPEAERVNNIETITAFVAQNEMMKDVSKLLEFAANSFKDNGQESHGIINDNLILSIASTSTEGFNRITGKEWVSVDKHVSESGNSRGFEISTPLFSFSRSTGK